MEVGRVKVQHNRTYECTCGALKSRCEVINGAGKGLIAAEEVAHIAVAGCAA